MIGILRHPALLAIVVVLTAVVVGGSIVPAPENWTRSPHERTVDLHTTASVTWHPVSGEWTIGEITNTVQESKLLNIRAYLANALSLTSETQRVTLTLNDGNGGIVDQQVEKTGRGGIFGTTKTVSAWFRQVEPATYTLSVQIVSDQGSVLAESTTPLVLVPLGES